MLGEQIRGILLPKHLFELQSPATDGLLDPQRVGVQVSQFSEALPGTDAKGRRGVRPDPQRR